MTHCRNIREQQFDERLDGRMEAVRSKEFDTHLAGCADCRQAWESYRTAWQLLGRHESIEPSVGFVERTLRQMDEPSPSPVPRLILRWLTATCVVVVLAAGGVAVHRSVESHRRMNLYVEMQQSDQLEDFDVIASLDQLNRGGQSL